MDSMDSSQNGTSTIQHVKQVQKVLRVQRGQRGGAAYFVILSGEKRRMLKNGLSEIGELSRRI